ncbi:MAG: hypothetical protein COB53_05805 [Elusimicrobia bacterium]|nr:MAG: hypothetical protein COB53_05805 [Elusimicrobiota bacterium]
MEGLNIGSSYNLLELKGIPYTVKNRGENTIDVSIESAAPDKRTLYRSYEPIPDPSWVTLTPNRVRINPGDAGFSGITISIPDDPKYAGRHFHALIMAKTINPGMFAASVQSHLRFSTGKGPKTLEAEARYAAMVKLNYDMWPSALYLKKAVVGKYDSFKSEGKGFLFTNRDEEEIELVISARPWGRQQSPPGYETPKDVSWAKFEPSLIKMDPLSLKRVKPMFDIPKEYAGRKLAFMVQLSLPIGTIVNFTHRVLLDVGDDGTASVTTEKVETQKKKSKKEKSK